MLNFEQVKKAANLVSIVGQYIALKSEGTRYVALCPFHEEKSGSFKIEKGKDRWCCYGCGLHGDVIDFVERYEQISKSEALRKVAQHAGIAEGDQTSQAGRGEPVRPAQTSVAKPKAQTHGQFQLVESYDYLNADGSFAYQVQRMESRPLNPDSGLKKNKEFPQRWRHSDGCWVIGMKEGHYRKVSGEWRRANTDNGIPSDAVILPGVERLLFNLPAVVRATETCLTEGEKDAITLTRLGFTATSASGGSSAPWLPSFTEALRGKRVIIFPDNDERGEQYGRRVEKALNGNVAELLYVPMPKGFKDITEFVEAGHNAEDVDSLIRAVEQEIFEKEAQHRGLLSPFEIVERFPGGLEAFIDAKKRPLGLQTGFHKLDELTLGLHPGELFVVAARPSMGKSALAGNIASNVALNQGKGVAIFNMEMTRGSILQRMVCSVGQIDSHKYRSGWLNQEEKNIAVNTFYRLADSPVRVDETAGMTLSEFERKIDIMRREMDLSLVIVDYLQQITPDKNKKSSGANRVTDISDISRGVKILAMRLGIPFLALCQLSRACELRPGDHRPILSDIRESGSIEQDADAVGFIYREEVYRPDKESVKGMAELILAKQRNGPTGTIKLVYQSRYTRFDSLAENYEEAA